MFDPEHPTLKSRIASGECLAVAWLALGSVAVAEATARARPDVIVLDMQHGLWERRDLEAAIGIVPAQIPVIVRVAENTALSIGTALDAGAEGVMVPMVETAADAKRAFQFAHFPPHGLRSGGGVRPLQNFPAYVAASSQIVVIPMIETAAGLAHASAIAKVKGLDMIFVGSGDLALSLQTFGGDPLKHVSACARIKRACDAASLPCGMFTGNQAAALAHQALGYSMVVVANDIDVVVRGFAGATDGFRQACGVERVASTERADAGGPSKRASPRRSGNSPRSTPRQRAS
jgi:2-keto-3-deoxy-L-rhamnonate aldolase RhmA